MSWLDVNDTPSDDSSYARARDVALRFLTYRPRSGAELRRRLAKQYSSATADRVVTSFRQHGLLDDADFARRWRQDREQHRPRSDRMLRQELISKGVPSEDIKAALAGFDNRRNAYAAGSKFARRLVSTAMSEEQFRKRLTPYLVRRGFSYSLTRETVDKLWQELAPDPLHGNNYAKDNQHQPPHAETEGLDYPTDEEGQYH